MAKAKTQSAPALPPGNEAMFSVSCTDVVMGRGSGTQNHCGNVTYRKLVFLNKELYATSSKFDKLKISKAIVGAVREFGGHFVQADDTRGGLYFDIGDKRAWDKTSQALREGQAEIRARLAEEDPAGMSKVAEYKQVISEQKFFAYACRVLDALYHPSDGDDSGISACGHECPHAKRRETLNQLGAHPMQIHQAMQAFASPPPLPPLPPPQSMQQLQPQQAYSMQHVQPSYNMNMATLGGTDVSQMNPTMQPYQGNLDPIQPLPFNAPVPEVNFESLDPLPYAQQLNTKTTPGEYIATEATAPNSYPNSLAPSEVSAPTSYQTSIEPLPYHNGNPGLQRPGLLSDRGTSSGTVFSLRKFCSEDFEMSSNEGKMLMDQLNQEVDDLIRRKSYGLIQIDTTHAFEDLVFEEDSMMLDDDPKGIVPKKEKQERKSGSSSSTSRSRHSSLSIKDDMSLMNMSILTLEEREEFDNISPKDEASPKEGSGAPRSIYKKSDPSTPKDIRKRGTRVSFAGRNASLMSMDDRSFSKLVDSISDPEGEADPERKMSGSSSDSPRSISRKMGFPMRKTVAQQYEAANGPPLEVGQMYAGRQERVSTLTITEDSVIQSEFTNLAGKVENPNGVENSLKLDMSLSNISAFNMSLLSDIDPELLK
mmetsp:Transcript_22988/g.49740  ORF Transcript_22988/g.49740 Transcript_22988/m.49740 type:complete len:651 (-) Transcript_22988:111-2063(-)|eukprot:CAMPEP_0172325894 /NCGR_PEP_ID=MMETSP1058-20130122/54956_1 /TAXON_ID=83371 /ORGANISM="Detonula confervacea, Strain CCMP 353" /LENGTH=650 /DNA_ID=CAMNT_0013042527 /DNA_START=154 /DNA_END=2106 /DNA_ORIENTATION=-